MILGITNREHEIMGYEVEIKVGGILQRTIGPVELAHEQGWREQVGFVARKPGENQKVQFLLYRVRRLDEDDGALTEILTFHLWIDVKEGS